MRGSYTMAISPNYLDPRLAAVYDALNPPSADTEFYLELAKGRSKSILDMGCGTGILACALGENSHRVVGVDPAAAMLSIAKQRLGSNKVTWIEADTSGLPSHQFFDLIIMSGHAFQVFLTDNDILAALRTFRQRLAFEGCLAFETRNPLARPWEQWTPGKTRRRVNVEAIGTVDVHHHVISVVAPFVTYETHFRFESGETIITSDTLRFIEQEALASMLEQSGFKDILWYGNWDRSPFNPKSSEIIVVAR